MCQAVLVRMIVSGRTSTGWVGSVDLAAVPLAALAVSLSTGVAGVVEYDPAMGTGAVVALNPW